MTSKKKTISLEEATKRFHEYYDNKHNNILYRNRAKRFDVMYQKKKSKTLHPNMPGSSKYLLPHGPKTFDMVGVDWFPEGEIINVNDEIKVTSKGYSTRIDDVDSDSQEIYGPRLNNSNKLYSEYFRKKYNERSDLKDKHLVDYHLKRKDNTNQLIDINLSSYDSSGDDESDDVDHNEDSEVQQTEDSEVQQTEDSEVQQTEDSEVQQTEDSEVQQTEDSEVQQTEDSEVQQTEDSEVQQTEDSEVQQTEDSEEQQIGGGVSSDNMKDTGLQDSDLKNTYKKRQNHFDYESDYMNSKNNVFLEMMNNSAFIVDDSVKTNRYKNIILNNKLRIYNKDTLNVYDSKRRLITNLENCV